jgi:GNAT superfamily N-acetyltransferase
MEIVRIGSGEKGIVEPEWLARCESVHRQLRPQIPPDYGARMGQIIAAGAAMCAAVDAETVLGVAVYRIIENTHVGRKLYVDDLVTDEARRSTGVGHALLSFLEGEARSRRCDSLELDSGTQRTQAHKFYFREGLVIKSFSFCKFL